MVVALFASVLWADPAAAGSADGISVSDTVASSPLASTVSGAGCQDRGCLVLLILEMVLN